MSHRIEKINDLIRDSVSNIILKHLSMKKGVFVSVLRVDTTKDMRYARVFVSVFPLDQKNYVLVTISKELHRIQGILGKQLSSKVIPKLRFSLDETQQDVSEVEEVFQQIHDEDKS